MFFSLHDELQELAQALALSATDLSLLQQRVAQFPQAASIFLQLLRHQEHASDEDGLWAESLAYGVLQQGHEFRNWLQGQQSRQGAHPDVPTTDPVLLSREHQTLLIRFNRPAARNAYSAAMRDALYEALLLLEADSSLERCVISGEGDCFCVGGDLAEFGLAPDAAVAHGIRMQRPVAALLLKHQQRIECFVHRACIGSGIELPACAGRLVATSETFFELPELSMGLIPGAGGTVSILRRMGRHRLAWWVLSGKKINAQTALAWGLIDEIREKV